MASAEMTQIFKIGKIKFYYAGGIFMFKGIHMWNGKNHIRLIPLNKFKNWTGKYDEDN